MRIRGGWLLWPMAGALLCLAYVLAPGDGFRSVITAAVSPPCVVFAIVTIRWTRPADTPLWYVLVGGLAVWAIGDVLYARNVLRLGTEPFPTWVDACYLAAYPLLIGGLFGLSRPPGRRSLAGLIDAAVIATGLGLVYWVFVIGPVAHDPTLPTLTRLTLVAYPTVGLLYIAVTMPLIFRIGGRSPTLWLLTLSSVSSLLGNAGYTFLTPDSLGYTVALGLYPFAYLTLAGAVRYAPRARSGADYVAERFGRGRLVLLGAATLPVSAVLVVQGLRGDPISWPPVAIGSVVLFSLVLARLAGFVTKVQTQAGQLADLAMGDELTGLPNRRRFEQRLHESLPGHGVQVAVLDLDGFKEVNDRLGHAAGDRLLAEVGQRLAATMRDGDMVARMGGDEFAVIVRDASPAVMDGIVERLSSALRSPVDLDGQKLLVGASIGSADNEGTDDPYEVLRRADVAMYAAKAGGERRHRRFSPAMDEDAGVQSRLGAELRAALDTGQFRLVYQPIVSLPDGRIVSVEALVRWEHPERGLVSPADFIPVAERNGLIVELGAWILRTACAQAVLWRNTFGGDAPQRMSVNVSARQLAEPDFPDLVASVLAWTGLGAANLVVEVTETAVFGGGQAVRSVKALHELGVRIALDDFGTGHSSLGLLQTVPVDMLKVDKSFVDNITMAGRHSVIATALIQVAHGLGLTAVAEGVETAEQAAELHRLGYRLAQGYHFGRPVAQPDFAAAAVP